MRRNRAMNVTMAILISMLCLSCGLLLCSLLGMPFSETTNDEKYIRDIIPRVLVSLVLLVFMKVVYKEIPIGMGKKGFWYGMAISFLMYLYIAENFIDSSSINTKVDFFTIPVHTYLLCFLSTMAVGLFEEVLLRGVVLNIMRKYFSGMRYGIYAAVFGSSFLFGIIHMLNYINGHAYFRPTVAQVFYATFLGVFMGAVYVRCKNLFVVILLHGLFDFAAEFWELVTPTYSFSKQDLSWEGVQYLICLYMPLLLAGAYITWRAAKKESVS